MAIYICVHVKIKLIKNYLCHAKPDRKLTGLCSLTCLSCSFDREADGESKGYEFEPP